MNVKSKQLQNRNASKMLVAVIDDGIKPDMFSIRTVKYDMYVTKRGWVRLRKPNELVTTLHGTTIAGIIRKYAPETEFCSIYIFSDGIMKTTCERLISALKWCLKMKIPIINLSLGTIDPDDFKGIKKIIDKLLKNDQIIIAACNINGKYTMPAMHPGVIGVQTDEELIDFNFKPAIDTTKGVNFIASSNHELVMPGGYTFRTQISNSFAVPTITAAIIMGQIKTK